MQTFWIVVFGAAIGYVAAVFTWDKVHTFIVGAETKIIDLRNKARALEAAVRGK